MVLLPISLLLIALLCAAVFAYGTEPLWAALGPGGFKFILFSTRFEWTLMVFSLLMCAGLLGYVLSAKKRVWWLVGLLPVLTLFYHRFSAGPAVGYSALQDPPVVLAKDADESRAELVVGIVVDSQPCAFAYSALQYSPVIVTSLGEQRVLLVWSALANRALAFTTDRDLRAADLEIVSSPDNALLVYNTRLGEFINGVNGKTPRGETPTGIHHPIPVHKTTWQNWVVLHPDTKLLPGSRGAPITTPQPPRYEMPGTDSSLKDPRRVCVVACTQPIAVPSELITDRPLNLTSGQTCLLLVRIDGIVRAFNRNLPGDLVPRFSPTTDAKHKNVVWADSDTNSKWSAFGAVVEGDDQMHGVVMSPLIVEDDLYWNVMKFWYPELHLATDAEITAAAAMAAPLPKVEHARGRKKKTVMHG